MGESMSSIEWLPVLIAVGFFLVVWQLSSLGNRLSQLMKMLQSIDAEVFHLAQEQNPAYGLCDNCGCRAIVRYVTLKDREAAADGTEMFYCQSCWWRSDSIQIGDEKKYYKDRLTERDRWAARAGPG